MKLIEAEKVKRVMKDYWKAQVDKALTLTFIDDNEANKRINSYLEHNHELLKAIDELPSAEQDTTTHDSIPAKTGKNDGDGTSGDCISRQATYLALVEKGQASKRYRIGETWELNGEEIREVLDTMSSTQPDIIRCKDCKYRIRHDKRCGYWNHGVKPTMWCSQAERREDE